MRYLAYDLGAQRIRVNAISADGQDRGRAGIPGFADMYGAACWSGRLKDEFGATQMPTPPSSWPRTHPPRLRRRRSSSITATTPWGCIGSGHLLHGQIDFLAGAGVLLPFPGIEEGMSGGCAANATQGPGGMSAYQGLVVAEKSWLTQARPLRCRHCPGRRRRCAPCRLVWPAGRPCPGSDYETSRSTWRGAPATTGKRARRPEAGTPGRVHRVRPKCYGHTS